MAVPGQPSRPLQTRQHPHFGQGTADAGLRGARRKRHRCGAPPVVGAAVKLAYRPSANMEAALIASCGWKGMTFPACITGVQLSVPRRAGKAGVQAWVDPWVDLSSAAWWRGCLFERRRHPLF